MHFQHKDKRHRSACLVSTLQECPHWRVFGYLLLRLTHCTPARCPGVSPRGARTPDCGHLRSGSCSHGRTWHGVVEGGLSHNVTYQIFKLKSKIFFIWLQSECTCSIAKYCPIEPNLGKCEATWLRLAYIPTYIHSWSNFHPIANSRPDFDFVDQSYTSCTFDPWWLHEEVLHI